MRMKAREGAIYALSHLKSIGDSSNWIRFPYYHHVFDDEKADFHRQLTYMKNFGEFISMDDACSMLEESDKINGRFFCLSFDDGFANCATNMVDVTESLEVPVIVYLPTKFMGYVPNEKNIDELEVFNVEGNPPVKFLTWEECIGLLGKGVDFGSHTVNHVALKNLSKDSLKEELGKSKSEIEINLGKECIHFACPWGRPDIDFDRELMPDLMNEFGFRSFSTTSRGKMDHISNDLCHIKRDHFLASWQNFQIKYFLSR